MTNALDFLRRLTKIHLLFIVIILQIINFELFAQTSWYVSTTSLGNASGNSWANKKIYTTFNWSNVAPGDVVYLDGGTDSLVYDINQYGINSHGTAALPILITKGVDASHNGKVVFRSTSTNYIGMSLSNISYTIFDNLKWKGGLSATGENWILDFGGNVQSVTFQYCEFELNYSCGIGTNSEQTSNNIKFLHCNIYNWLDTGTNSSSDMMWLGGQNHTNWEIAYCNIINKNPKTGATPSSAHRDLVQFSWGFGGAGGTTKIHHNFFDDRSAGAAGACIEAYDVGGNWEIYNNIWKSNSTGANGSGDFSLISMSIPRSAGAVWGIRTWFSSMKLYNNTFYATTSHVSPLFLIGFSSVDVRNNIFYAPSLGSGSIFLATDLYTQNHSMTWDYNQYYNNAHSNIMAGYGDTGVGIADGASTFTWTQWRAAGYDAHSTYNTNTPTFVTPTGTNGTDYALQSGSDGINDGNTIAFVTNDYSGTLRPQGTAYDLGAFEYTENVIDTTAPNLQGAILNNSTQLILNFSEPLNAAIAQNINNYSISNGISVLLAVLSGTQVTLTTSAHVSSAYVVTVNNVTDLQGNVINPNNKTANYNYTAADVTPPQVVSAALTNSTTLVINFSEALNSTTAQNKSNYSITNGIIVSSAVLSGTQVTLTTSAHVSSAYVVTVNNVTDLAGNVINPNNKTANYNYTAADVLKLNILQARASNWYLDYTPSKSADGINVGESRWGGAISMPDTIEFILDNIQILTKTKLTFYNWNLGRIYNYSILVSSDYITWNQIRTNIPSQPQEWSIEEVSPIAAKYIKIIFLSNNQGGLYAGLWEAEFWGNSSLDVTPPQVVSATLTNPTQLVINFSETLNSTTAQNKSNYLINNGVTVSSAVLSGTQVTLTTSSHSAGTYMVTVNNVTDISGNLVDPLHKTANYINAIDNIRPYFTSLTVTNSKSITVKFSEKLNPVKAKNKNNYSITNGIVINSVILLPDSSSIKISTSPHSKNQNYTLTISNVTDRVGNVITPNPKTVGYKLPKTGTANSLLYLIEGAVSNNWDPNYLPEKTIDGEATNNPASRWMSSSITMPDTIGLDMGNICAIDSLRISFYQWESGRLFKYSLYGSFDSLTWEPIVTDLWSDSLDWSEIEFDSTQARFVKLILLESNQILPASIWEIELYGPSGVTGINNETEIPNSYTLSQNYPNPFNPATSISYTLPEKSRVNLKIFDLLGAEVVELVNSELEPGAYKIDFNANGLPSGVYFYRLETKSFIETKKMILLK